MRFLLLLCLLPLLVMQCSADKWPGENNVITVDRSDDFPPNMSGLYFAPGTNIKLNNNSDNAAMNVTDSSTDILWAVVNKPALLYKLYFNGKDWTPINDHWKNGKQIYYTNGKGSPDSEDLTFANNGMIYLCTERDNTETISKLKILQLANLDDTNPSLIASMEWDVTSLLPPSSDSNIGLEAITWISDSFLIENQFYDQSMNKLYNPLDYPGHGDGLFFVGYEFNGNIYAVALDHEDTSKVYLVQSFSSGEVSIMSLGFDNDSGYLWSECDNTCDGRSHVLTIDEKGIFNAIAMFERPSTMPNYNNEGITFVPDSYCKQNGQKQFFFADDDDDDKHAIRQDTIPCGKFIK